MKTLTPKAILKKYGLHTQVGPIKPMILSAISEAIEQSKPRWISVEEGLPDFNVKVFCMYIPDHPIMEVYDYGVSRRIETKGTSISGSRLADKLKEQSGFDKNVKFWMPLPSPPSR
jgi:hypothetical protein